MNEKEIDEELAILKKMAADRGLKDPCFTVMRGEDLWAIVLSSVEGISLNWCVLDNSCSAFDPSDGSRSLSPDWIIIAPELTSAKLGEEWIRGREVAPETRAILDREIADFYRRFGHRKDIYRLKAIFPVPQRYNNAVI